MAGKTTTDVGGDGMRMSMQRRSVQQIELIVDIMKNLTGFLVSIGDVKSMRVSVARCKRAHSSLPQHLAGCCLSRFSNKRTGGGLRLCWNRGVVPSFTQRWRTADDAVPWMTFTHHHFLSLPKESENLRYNCDDCCKRLVPAIQYAQEMAVAAAAGAPEQAPGETGGNQPPARARAKLAVMESALEQNVYLGLHSLIHNQSFMGISKERGGFSF